MQILENILHIMQHTRPDIMYAVNRISSHATAPSAPVLQSIKELIWDLARFPQHSNMYPDGYIGSTTHDLHQEFYQGKIYSKNISNGLVELIDIRKGCSPNDRYATYCVILCIFGVAVLWSEKLNHPLQHIQQDQRSAIFYFATKMVQWLGPILQNL